VRVGGDINAAPYVASKCGKMEMEWKSGLMCRLWALYRPCMFFRCCKSGRHNGGHWSNEGVESALYSHIRALGVPHCRHYARKTIAWRPNVAKTTFSHVCRHRVGLHNLTGQTLLLPSPTYANELSPVIKWSRIRIPKTGHERKHCICVEIDRETGSATALIPAVGLSNTC